MRTQFTKLMMVAALMGGLVACNAEVVDIDRTGPDKVSKEIFKGEWYFRPVIVESQYADSLLFEGLEGDMERIRWVIEEKALIAYRSYELLEGAELDTTGGEFQGNPVAIFPIKRHYDVRREYNKSTGEQSNVLVEDTSSRPWHQRDHMFVDWSTNMHWNPYALDGAITAYAAAGHFIQEQAVDSPWHPEVTETNINVVGEYFFQPDYMNCLYTTGYDWLSLLNCPSTNGKMKLSFMKVPESDYVALNFPDYVPYLDDEGKPIQTCSEVDATNCSTEQQGMFQKFGFFRTERRKYDPKYQFTRDGRMYVANRWNIWKTSRDAKGDVLPMSKRLEGEVVYHTNVDFPIDSDIWKGTNKLVEDWDKSFRKTVLSRRQLENPAATIDSINPIFVLKENSCTVQKAISYATAHKHQNTLSSYGITEIVKGNLKRACAVLEHVSKGDFTWEKTADLRHSFFHWVDTPQNGPLGYGPSSADPISGELISANANIYGASIDRLSAYAADIVELMNNDIDTANLVNGTHVREHMKSHRFNAQIPDAQGRHAGFDLEKMERMNREFRSQNHMERVVNSSAPEKMAKGALRVNINAPTMTPEMREMATATSRAKLQRLRGSRIDRELLTSDEHRRGILGPDGFQPGVGTAHGARDFSALDWTMDEFGYQKAMDSFEKRLAEDTILLESWADEGMASMALELKDMNWEEVYTYMRENIYRGVMAHEVGHTIGLRHNFEGSMDPLNFHHSFWDHYDVAKQKIEYVDDNEEPTKAERLMYSTIMDYDARFYADSFEGIGPYDNAAIHFGYGEMVEVFDGDFAALGYQSLLFLNSYHDIPKVFDGSLSCPSSFENCHGDYTMANAYYGDYRNAEDEVTSDTNYALYGRYLNSYYKDALKTTAPKPENISKRKFVPNEVVYQEWSDYHNDVDYSIPYDEVPYAFCPDEYRWESNVRCQAWDKGANMTEVIQDRALRHDRYYLFSNFKRDRFEFGLNLGSYAYRVYSRYFSAMAGVYRYYFYGNNGMGYDKNGDYLYLTDFGVGRDWQASAMEGLNYLASVVNQPEPGWHCKNNDNTYVSWDDGEGNILPGCASGDELEIPLGVGKNLRTKWTDEYNYKVTQIGNYWDKYVALWAMTSNEGNFYRNYADWFDSGSFSLSYWRSLRPEMVKFFGPAITGKHGDFSWRLDTDGKILELPIVDIYKKQEADIADDEYVRDTSALALPKIAGSWSWTLRYYATVLPMVRFNSMYDYTIDYSSYGRICLNGYRDCMSMEADLNDDGTMEANLTTYVDPITGYTYHSPGVLESDDQQMQPYTLSGLMDIAEADYLTLKATGGVGEQELHRSYLEMKEAKDNYEMHFGAHMLVEAQEYATNTYTPALTTWQAAKANYETLNSTVNRDALVAAEVVLEKAEAGVNDRASSLDIMRDMAYVTEFGG